MAAIQHSFIALTISFTIIWLLFIFTAYATMIVMVNKDYQ